MAASLCIRCCHVLSAHTHTHRGARSRGGTHLQSLEGAMGCGASNDSVASLIADAPPAAPARGVTVAPVAVPHSATAASANQSQQQQPHASGRRVVIPLALSSDDDDDVNGNHSRVHSSRTGTKRQGQLTIGRGNGGGSVENESRGSRASVLTSSQLAVLPDSGVLPVDAVRHWQDGVLSIVSSSTVASHSGAAAH